MMRSIVLAGALCALASPVLAHALLQRASPRVGSIVKAAPADIRLEFSEAVEPVLSRIGLRDAHGAAVGLGPPKTAPGAANILTAPITAKLASGVYKVEWRVVSTDSHVTAGDFSFTVKP